MTSAYIFLIIIFAVALVQNRNRKAWSRRFVKPKEAEGKTGMQELAKRFVGKECLVYTFNSQLAGTIREVGGGAILIETGGTAEAVNTDWIVRIREYPRNRSGRKKLVVLD